MLLLLFLQTVTNQTAYEMVAARSDIRIKKIEEEEEEKSIDLILFQTKIAN